jgi:hypothetical protein
VAVEAQSESPAHNVLHVAAPQARPLAHVIGDGVTHEPFEHVP